MQTLGMLFGAGPFAIAATSTVNPLHGSTLVAGRPISRRRMERLEDLGAAKRKSPTGGTDVFMFDLSPPSRVRPPLHECFSDREIADLTEDEVSGGNIFQSHDHVASENLQ